MRFAVLVLLVVALLAKDDGDVNEPHVHPAEARGPHHHVPPPPSPDPPPPSPPLPAPGGSSTDSGKSSQLWIAALAGIGLFLAGFGTSRICGRTQSYATVEREEEGQQGLQACVASAHQSCPSG